MDRVTAADRPRWQLNAVRQMPLKDKAEGALVGGVANLALQLLSHAGVMGPGLRKQVSQS